MSGFLAAPKFTQVTLQPFSTFLELKPHPPINEPAIVMALGLQPGKNLLCQK